MAESGAFSYEAYARTLSHIGKAVWLPTSQCWAIERDIRGSGRKDLMGTYPMMGPISDDALFVDLNNLAEKYVSFVGITNPMLPVGWSPSINELASITQYKPHFVADLSLNPATWLGPTAIRNIGYAQKHFSFRELFPAQGWKELANLYRILKRRVKHLGYADFSRDQIERQCCIQGARVFTIQGSNACDGAALVYVADSVVYFHLAAYSSEGYANRGGYALVAGALDALRESGVRWAHLGGAPDGPNGEGIAEFKRRLSTETRMSHIVKVVMQPYEYARLSGGIHAGYFPSYRKPKKVAA